MKKVVPAALLSLAMLMSCEITIGISSNINSELSNDIISENISSDNSNENSEIESMYSEDIKSDIEFSSNDESIYSEELISSEQISSNNSQFISSSENSPSSETQTSISESHVVSNNKLEKLTILSINDLHGSIEQENSKGGISNLSYKINNYRNQNNLDDVVLIANGDMFQGQAISNLNHGLSVVNAMNAMNFDAMGIGNHEFDWGIERILRFFDGDDSNGEANFPLVNANIIENDTNELLDYTIPYEIVYKENLKVGIVSAIGVDQSSSILKPLMDPYSFTNVATAIGNYTEYLRTEENCDIIICNVHDGGDYNSYHETDLNKELAKLSGNKKIDALINGHSHYKYRGYISRTDGSASLPIVQAGGNGNALGVIELTINKDSKQVTSVNAFYNQESTTSYDKDVQDIVDAEYELLKDQLEEVYCVSGENVTATSTLRSWAGSCIQKATGADIAFSNNGGLRNVNLTSNGNITVSDLYEIMPFDNKILIATVSGQKIKNFINSYSSSNYYSIKNGVTIENSSSKYYTVAVIDYLGYKNYFPLGNNYEDSGLLYRDLMGEDLRIRHKNGQKFYPSSNYESVLNCLI